MLGLYIPEDYFFEVYIDRPTCFRCRHFDGDGDILYDARAFGYYVFCPKHFQEHLEWKVENGYEPPEPLVKPDWVNI